MATDFRYADITTLTKYFNRVNDFNSKVQIFPSSYDSNKHIFENCGYAPLLFVNGEELDAAESAVSDVNVNGEWFYDSSTNKLTYYNSGYTATTVNEQVFEIGQDFRDFLHQALTDASLELHNYLDARFSTPIEKSKQIDINTATASTDEEYDPIIIKATCYLTAANVIRAKEGASEEADYYYSLVTNADGTGIIDKLNDGVYKLSNEIDNKDSKGKIKYRSVSGTMDIVELYGDYHGEKYDLLKVEVTVTGAYGVAKFKVLHHGEDKLWGQETSEELITGGLQELYGGLYGRFQGLSATDGDYWELEVYSDALETSNTKTNIIQMHRK